MFQNIQMMLANNNNPFEAMVEPITGLLNMVLPAAIVLIGSIGTIYCIFLGLKLAKADEPQEHQKAKGALKNAIIGFVLIFVLVVALKVAIDPLKAWISGYDVVVDF